LQRTLSSQSVFYILELYGCHDFSRNVVNITVQNDQEIARYNYTEYF